MSASIVISGIKATIKNYQWTTEDATLRRLLNVMLNPLGPSGADPNPDLTAAQMAADTLGGEVIEFEEADFVSGRVY